MTDDTKSRNEPIKNIVEFSINIYLSQKLLNRNEKCIHLKLETFENICNKNHFYRK